LFNVVLENMKKFFLPILFVLITTSIYAQQDLGQINVSIRGVTETYSAEDTLGHLGYVFQAPKVYEVIFLNSTYASDRNIIVNRNPKFSKDKMVGATMNNEVMTVYLYNKKLRTISTLNADRSSSSGSYQKLITLTKDEEYLKGISMNGRFFVLTVPKYKNGLKIYTITNGNSAEATSYEIEMPVFFKKLVTGNQNLNDIPDSHLGIQEIKYSLENNIKSSYPDKKLYYHHDKIYMTFDEPGCTHLIEIDPLAHKSSYKKLNFSLEKGNTSKNKQGNSFLYDNRLFRATISPEQMNLSILDLDNITLINSYNFYPEDEIGINNGPVVQEGGSTVINVQNEKVLKKPQQYFKSVLNSNLCIAANKIDDQKYEVEVGSYEEIITSRGGGFGGSGLSLGIGLGGVMMGGGGGFGGYPMGGGYGFPSGGMGFPGGYSSYGGFPGYYPYGGGGSGSRIRMVYFKTLLSNNDFKHLEGDIPKTMRENINDYEQSYLNNVNLENIRVSSYSDKVIIGYYIRSQKKYRLVEFKKS
jgi:hypothetical protein